MKKPPTASTRAAALTWKGTGAPRLTAKGAGETAERIIARARECGVPLYENAELARLLSRIELGDEIPVALYRACAEVIAFAFALGDRNPGSP